MMVFREEFHFLPVGGQLFGSGQRDMDLVTEAARFDDGEIRLALEQGAADGGDH